MGSHRIQHDWVTELNWTSLNFHCSQEFSRPTLPNLVIFSHMWLFNFKCQIKWSQMKSSVISLTSHNSATTLNSMDTVRTLPQTLQKVPLDKTALVQGSTTLSCKGKYWNSKYFRLCWPYSLFRNYSTLMSYCESRCWQHVNQVWVRSHKTFTKTGGELDLAHRPSFANLYPRPSPPLSVSNCSP